MIAKFLWDLGKIPAWKLADFAEKYIPKVFASITIISHEHTVQGPVPQSPIKLILDKWKMLIAIYLLLKKDFSQDEGLRKRNL